MKAASHTAWLPVLQIQPRGVKVPGKAERTQEFVDRLKDILEISRGSHVRQ
jgi:hypothetical protein